MKEIIASAGMMLSSLGMMAQTNLYSFSAQDSEGKNISLADYKDKVVLIVNTASRCGFTPQYEELEAMYSKLRAQGFEILDFPCNQFGQQAPESDEEYVSFCRLNYKTEFKQFHKIDVNGKQQIPLYKWLKEEKGFEGFDKDHKLTAILEGMFDKNMPGWRTTSDIKWNFTKFLIDRNGNVIARFEPTVTSKEMLPVIESLLKK